MKQAFTKHPKFGRLVRDLGIPPQYVLGLCQYLWAAADETGIPIFGDAFEIEHAAGWTGEPGKFARALASCGCDADGQAGLIERVGDSDPRWRLHDYWDHCPVDVAQRAERAAKRGGRSISDVRREAANKRWAAKHVRPMQPDANAQVLHSEGETASRMQTRCTCMQMQCICNAKPPSSSPPPSLSPVPPLLSSSSPPPTFLPPTPSEGGEETTAKPATAHVEPAKPTTAPQPPAYAAAGQFAAIVRDFQSWRDSGLAGEAGAPFDAADVAKIVMFCNALVSGPPITGGGLSLKRIDVAGMALKTTIHAGRREYRNLGYAIATLGGLIEDRAAGRARAVPAKPSSGDGASAPAAAGGRGRSGGLSNAEAREISLRRLRGEAVAA